MITSKKIVPDIKIIKKSGDSEQFDINKLVKSLLNSGVDYSDVEPILSNLYENIDEGMTTDELKKSIFSVLKEYEAENGSSKYSEKYLYDNCLKIRTSGKEFEGFDKHKIAEALINEANADETIALKIANEVEKELKKMDVKYLTAPMIREVVNYKLIEHGFEDIRHKHTRLGIPVYDIDRLINHGSKDNANLMHNPESIHKWVADETMKEYALMKIFPKHIADLHMKGDIHLHDLEYAAVRTVCCQHDLRPFLMHGLKVDGTGRHTSVSKPAKNPEVAIQHAAKVLSAAQCEMSGGQSIDEFNVWLAPYMRGLSYSEVKQLMQMFIYEMNQIYAARGGQVVFSTVNLELEAPDFLKDKPAIKNGQIVGTYEEYDAEIKIIAEALTEVLMGGDAYGKPFLFPNIIFKLRENAFKNENYELLYKIHKLSAKWGLPYFINMTADYQVGNTNAMGCRTRLSGDWGNNVEESTLRTGNMQWYTLNLPRIAYEAKGDDTRLFELLNERLHLVQDALQIKHKISQKRLYGDEESRPVLPFLTQEFDDTQYYRYDNTTKTFGFVGLNELLKYHMGEELHTSKDAVSFGEKVIGHIKNYADDLKKETGLRWTVTQTPAESTAGRFARLDHKYYKEQTESVVNGNLDDLGSIYYTNSSHVKVNSDVTLGEKVSIEEKFHPLCNGGHIGHFWNAEAYADPDVLMSITKKICDSNIGFWTYTKNLSICEACNKAMTGLKDNCNNCGSDSVEKFSRITGYLQNVSNWNSAKQKELLDRKSNLPRL
ncbi:anaerobic ribonucleoside-triphosphate reductase [Methanococcus voltae]|uniref:Ribonucleoside-triphosphate reductase n=2 Tax=Methanococcus voltae TaxID=2188 RepID=A0A8J7RJ36_METVO|nr:anaerobic ribonucleoside-triphosphate reductase [Methanococcus voltae]MBP2172769.1 ribonucleoside-triphosphate reductase [Methanococcus voltae]MBP2201821.1 ribonucleoside-triphosphate reductase [Methanococcus voltae]MCS3922645.1 ribonucleoside-triphosphate reductase [Methanococcus voltae PS]